MCEFFLLTCDDRRKGIKIWKEKQEEGQDCRHQNDLWELSSREWIYWPQEMPSSNPFFIIHFFIGWPIATDQTINLFLLYFINIEVILGIHPVQNENNQTLVFRLRIIETLNVSLIYHMNIHCDWVWTMVIKNLPFRYLNDDCNGI